MLGLQTKVLLHHWRVLNVVNHQIKSAFSLISLRIRMVGSFRALSLADARSECQNHRSNRGRRYDPHDEKWRIVELATLATYMRTGIVRD